VRPDWLNDAACKGMDPAIFAPWPASVSISLQAPALADGAKRICARCPVTAECEADGKGDSFSVRGGKTPSERRKAGTFPCPTCGMSFSSAQARGSHERIHSVRPCGSDAAYQRHLRKGEDPCPACRDAHRIARWARDEVAS
jgi:WhiB family transcriptional regulator, redox-sensing transcriptional regulator